MIANRILETVLYHLFLSSMENQKTDIYKAALQDKNKFIDAGRLNMELLLEKFVIHFDDLFGDCRGGQFVVEWKIWHGNAYKERGERQLIDYLEHYHLRKGYMLSFSFHKKKQIGIRRIVLGDKVLIEAVVQRCTAEKNI